MSIIFHQITSQNGGVLPLNLGSGAVVGGIPSQGLLVDEDGAVYATLDTPPAAWLAGLPFDANGRLVVEQGAITSYFGGLAFTATGALSVSEDTGTPVYNQGVLLNGGALRVNGLGPPPVVPTAAENLAVTTAGIEELLVSWDPLVFDPVVTGYTVYWRIVGAPSWTSATNGTSTTRLITGLTSGETYELTVTATNSVGEGPQATPVTAEPINIASNIALFTTGNPVIQQGYRMDTNPWTPIDLMPPGLTGSSGLACAYSPVTQLLAFGFDAAPFLQVYDASKFPLVAVPVANQPGGTVNWLEFSQDGTALVAATADTFPSLIYDTGSWTTRDLDAGENTQGTINATKDRVAFGCPSTNPNGNLQIWDTSLPVPVLMAPLPSIATGNIAAVHFHPAQNILAAVVGVSSAAPRVYDLTSLTYLGDVASTANVPSALKFSTQGNLFAVGRSVNGFRVFDCSALSTPASWVNIPSGVTLFGAMSFKPLIFSNTDEYLAARSGPTAQAFDMSTAPLAFVPEFYLSWGTNQQSTFLNMPTPPPLPLGPPQNLVATPGASEGILTWDLLTDPNPITGYMVSYKEVIATGWTNFKLGVVNTYTFTGLTPGTSYDVRVCAINTGGWGAYATSTVTPV